MSSNFTVYNVATEPYLDQEPGTSGLRKKVTVFQQKNYTENFIQATLSSMGDALEGSVLVVGGDGRYFSKNAINHIISIAAGNKVRKLIIGQHGILSTPAVSNLIRRKKADGGIILTASHNPGGPDKDFGIKFNIKNGGPAPQVVTREITRHSTLLKSYKNALALSCNIDEIGTYNFRIDGNSDFTVEVIDSVMDYVQLMKDIFDFDSIRELFRTGYSIRIDCLNGVTGPYAERIFVNELGAAPGSVVNNVPLPDFGGLHPDPNLTYAVSLVEAMKSSKYDFGAAFDGDGDRNMILGKSAFFVTPSDSLAVLADHLDHIPYFRLVGIKGFARSMPTAAAVDRVAERTGTKFFEVPTGWKFFGNLMDAQQLSLCGEESFGTGSDHIREKDGIWAALAWLQIIACEKKGVECLVSQHWAKYGRNFFTRYDYEDCDAEKCKRMMTMIEELITTPKFVGRKFESNGKTFVVKLGDNFSYTDPIDASVSKKQGLRIIFEDGSRIVFRLSGTGSSGATVRVYIDSYESTENMIYRSAEDVLAALIGVALEISQIKSFTGRDKPTVIT